MPVASATPAGPSGAATLRIAAPMPSPPVIAVSTAAGGSRSDARRSRVLIAVAWTNTPGMVSRTRCPPTRPGSGSAAARARLLVLDAEGQRRAADHLVVVADQVDGADVAVVADHEAVTAVRRDRQLLMLHLAEQDAVGARRLLERGHELAVVAADELL